MILVPVTVTVYCWNALHYTLYIISVKCFLFFSGLADQQEEYLYAGCSRSISWYISFFVTHRTWSAVSSTRLLQYSRSIRAATVTYSSWCSRIVSVHQSIWKKEEHYTCHWGSGFVFLIAYLTIYIIKVIFVLKKYFLYHIISLMADLLFNRIADVVCLKHTLRFCLLVWSYFRWTLAPKENISG